MVYEIVIEFEIVQQGSRRHLGRHVYIRYRHVRVQVHHAAMAVEHHVLPALHVSAYEFHEHDDHIHRSDAAADLVLVPRDVRGQDAVQTLARARIEFRAMDESQRTDADDQPVPDLRVLFDGCADAILQIHIAEQIDAHDPHTRKG